MQLQLTGPIGTVEDGDPLIFDTIVNNLSPNISYDVGTGEITITKTGNYYVSWWIGIDGVPMQTYAMFGINYNGIQTINAGVFPLQTQLFGQALIPIITVPATVTLVNTTGDQVGYGGSPIKADLVILELTT
jgi:hypothetical protein